MSAIDSDIYVKMCDRRGCIHLQDEELDKATNIALYVIGERAPFELPSCKLSERAHEKLSLLKEIKSGKSGPYLKQWLGERPRFAALTPKEALIPEKWHAGALYSYPFQETARTPRKNFGIEQHEEVQIQGLLRLYAFFDEYQESLQFEGKVAIQRLLWVHSAFGGIGFWQLLADWCLRNPYRAIQVDSLRARFEDICPNFQLPGADLNECGKTDKTLKEYIHDRLLRHISDFYQLTFSEETKIELLQRMESPRVFFDMCYFLSQPMLEVPKERESTPTLRTFAYFLELRDQCPSNDESFLFEIILFRTSEHRIPELKKFRRKLQLFKEISARFLHSNDRDLFSLLIYLLSNEVDLTDINFEEISIQEFIQLRSQHFKSYRRAIGKCSRLVWDLKKLGSFTDSQAYFLSALRGKDNFEGGLAFLHKYYQVIGFPPDRDFCFHFLFNLCFTPLNLSKINEMMDSLHPDFIPEIVQALYDITAHLPIHPHLDVGFPMQFSLPKHRKLEVVRKAESKLLTGVEGLFAMDCETKNLERVLFVHEAFVGETYAEALAKWGGEEAALIWAKFPEKASISKGEIPSNKVEKSFQETLIQRTIHLVELELGADLSEQITESLTELLQDECIRRDLAYAAHHSELSFPLLNRLEFLVPLPQREGYDAFVSAFVMSRADLGKRAVKILDVILYGGHQGEAITEFALGCFEIDIIKLFVSYLNPLDLGQS